MKCLKEAEMKENSFLGKKLKETPWKEWAYYSRLSTFPRDKDWNLSNTPILGCHHGLSCRRWPIFRSSFRHWRGVEEVIVTGPALGKRGGYRGKQSGFQLKSNSLSKMTCYSPRHLWNIYSESFRHQEGIICTKITRWISVFRTWDVSQDWILVLHWVCVHSIMCRLLKSLCRTPEANVRCVPTILQ